METMKQYRIWFDMSNQHAVGAQQLGRVQSFGGTARTE
jgi:hypothetical protein